VAVQQLVGRGLRAPAIPSSDVAALTDRGAAAVALIRFERLFRALGPADRQWFADELAELAEEAEA
jgi:hypothetical protein